MIDQELLNFAVFSQYELMASSPYKTGNMQRSIATIVIDDNTIDIIIAVDYASYVNACTKWKNWVERVMARCARCKYGNAVDTKSMDTGLNPNVLL